MFECIHSWYTGEKLDSGRSEAQRKYVKLSHKSTGAYFWKRICQVFQTVPIWDNFYLSLFIRGRRGFDPESNPAFAPPFLTREGFLKLKVSIIQLGCYVSACISVRLVEIGGSLPKFYYMCYLVMMLLSLLNCRRCSDISA